LETGDGRGGRGKDVDVDADGKLGLVVRAHVGLSIKASEIW
jgi:hypothetical protein